MIVTGGRTRQVSDPAVWTVLPSSMKSFTNGKRFSAAAPGIRRMSIRPISGPSSCAAMITKVPRTPAFALIQRADVGLIDLDPPAKRSRRGRTIARRNLCSHVHAVF